MGWDRISELPNPLLTQILSYLPTKDSVKTSVLSKKWEFLWLDVPVLDLDDSDFPTRHGKDCESFIDEFLAFNYNLRMQKFKLKCKTLLYYGPLVRWIERAVDSGIQHLDVATDIASYLPSSIYQSKTLVSLKLIYGDIPEREFIVSLPCLKTMHLEDISYKFNPLIMEKVISGCPGLEDLTFITYMDNWYLEVPEVLRARSQSLKRFCLTFVVSYGMAGTYSSVEIDAPRLEYLSFNDNQSDMIVVKNLTSLFTIDIDTQFKVKFGDIQLSPSKRDTIRDFLTGISSVRHMIISQRTLEVFDQYPYLWPFPKFGNLYRLEAAFSSSMLQFLPFFLESCPNLKKLILDFAFSVQPLKTELSYAPRCLISTLECVEIMKLNLWEENGIKLMNYFLENAAVLKKLSVSFTDSMTNQERDFYMNLLITSTWHSRECQVFVY